MRVKQRGDLGCGGVAFFGGVGGGDSCVKDSGKCRLPISPRKEKLVCFFLFFFTRQEIAYSK